MVMAQFSVIRVYFRTPGDKPNIVQDFFFFFLTEKISAPCLEKWIVKLGKQANLTLYLF